MNSRFVVAGIAALLSFGLAACGDGEEEVAGPPATEQASPAVEPTPANEPIITDNLFEFADRGYSVRFPEGWTPEPNFLPGPGFSADAFFAPDEIRGIQPNISVVCETTPAGMTLQEYFDAKVDVVRQVVQVEPDVSSRDVSDQEALVFRYAREEGEPPLEKAQAVFISERCGWVIAMTVPLGGGAEYQDLFDEFLDSFTLVP